MKGIYLFACRARHENYDLDYNDIDGKFGCNITGDAMKVNLKSYDFIIASPPCNWWSKASQDMANMGWNYSMFWNVWN